MTGKALLTDARNRALRTLLQGAAAAAVVQVLAVVSAALEGSEDILTLDANAVGRAALTAGVTAAVSFLHRTVLDPSKLPSAQPPGDEA